MAAKVLLLLALVAAAAVDGQSYEDRYDDYSDTPNYEYHYSVHGNYGNNHGKQESRHGGRTDGSYYVYLPDGRLQKVYYYVYGDSGFVADVRYDSRESYDSHESYDSNDSYEAQDRYRSREYSQEYEDRS